VILPFRLREKQSRRPQSHCDEHERSAASSPSPFTRTCHLGIRPVITLAADSGSAIPEANDRGMSSFQVFVHTGKVTVDSVVQRIFREFIG
jgi:hypothetical protein